MTRTRVVLDEYFEPDERQRIDFLKVDTDGGDSTSCVVPRKLRQDGILGLAVEAQFHGVVAADANLFSNVDRYLRGFGFGLFDLEVNRYSRRALPAEFALDLPAQTVTGQISLGEAIYFRDLGDPHDESMWGFPPTGVEVFKFMCLFEIFGLPDCAAELILKYGRSSGDERMRTELLDVLAADQEGAGTTYAGLQRRFTDEVRRRFAPASGGRRPPVARA